MIARTFLQSIHGVALFFVVSKMPFRHYLYGRIGSALGLNPAGVLPFRNHASAYIPSVHMVLLCFLRFRRCCFGTTSLDALAVPWARILLGLCRFATMPDRASCGRRGHPLALKTCFAFSGFESIYLYLFYLLLCCTLGLLCF